MKTRVRALLLPCVTGIAVTAPGLAQAPGVVNPKEQPAKQETAQDDPVVDLPAYTPPKGPPRIVVAVTKEGKVIYNGREIGIAGVQPLVKRLLKKSEREFLVQCSGATPAGALVKVIDEAKLGGAKKVSLATERVRVAAPSANPEPIHRVAPRINEELQDEGPARVTVEFVVGVNGSIQGLKVQGSTDHRFDKPTLDAIRQWRFFPGKKDGAAIPMRVRLPIEFPGADGTRLDPETPPVLDGEQRKLNLDQVRKQVLMEKRQALLKAQLEALVAARQKQAAEELPKRRAKELRELLEATRKRLSQEAEKAKPSTQKAGGGDPKKKVPETKKAGGDPVQKGIGGEVRTS